MVSGTQPIYYTWNNGSFAAGISLFADYTPILTVNNMCGSHVDTMDVQFKKSPTIFFKNKLINECYTQPVLLKPIITGSQPLTYKWNNGTNDTMLYTSQSATYYCIAKNVCGSDSDAMKVNLIPIPLAIYKGETFTICNDTIIKLNVHNKGSNYLWSPSLTTDSTYIATKSGWNYIQITNQTICTIKDSVQVKMVDCNPGLVFMPNAFSPNGDGLDDYLFPIIDGANAHLTQFKVFNRWGQVVYSPDLFIGTKGWDGTFAGSDQPIGTYFYIVEYNNFKDPKVLKGDVILLR
jgi:gliding motility-associated-like protein